MSVTGGEATAAAAGPAPDANAALRNMAIVGVAVLAALWPWANKPLAIDDPLFVWTAKRIVAAPTDPYGFDVNWYGSPEPMSRVTQNPPLASYLLAAVGALAGWREDTLHLACWPFAVLAAWGCFRLAERFCGQPLLATLLCVFTPAFLVSATSLMCDVPMLALWVWAVWFWVRGFDTARPGPLFLAAALVALAILTKYSAVSLLPLLGAYAAFRRAPALERDAAERAGSVHGAPGILTVVAALVLPVACLAAFEYASGVQYGAGHFSSAMFYASRNAGAERDGLGQLWRALVMTGGCLPVGLLLGPVLWSRKTLLCLVAIGAAMAGLVALVPRLAWTGDWPVSFASLGVHVAVFAAAGLAALLLPWGDIWRRRDAESLLLVLWVLGVFVFAGFVNWTINARSVLPMAPAVAILAVRRLEARGAARSALAWSGVVLAGLLSMGVAWADYSQAMSARNAALTLWTLHRGGATCWYQGHWGFQYYLDALGARHTDSRGTPLAAGDRLLIPTNNTNIVIDGVLGEAVTPKANVVAPGTQWLSTVHMNAASFYGGYGPLPYAFGDLGADAYVVCEVREPYLFAVPAAAAAPATESDP